MSTDRELPEPAYWMTRESVDRLADGGNSKGAVPVHGRRSSTAVVGLYTAEQVAAVAAAALREGSLAAKPARREAARPRRGKSPVATATRTKTRDTSPE